VVVTVHRLVVDVVYKRAGGAADPSTSLFYPTGGRTREPREGTY